ncbi:MAG: thioester reductase domain-containing protein [Polyangiales bacterium]
MQPSTVRPARPPIAIVGMACRFPGAPSLTALWRVLTEGRCTLREVPRDRYDVDLLHGPTPGAPGRIASREGGFLDDLRGFDAGLFQISHREAMAMDPQHRQLLEVSWDAFEDAGLPLERVSGAAAAVYVGLFTSDYRERMLRTASDDLDVYSEIGTTRSSAAGRISHAFNLTGPAAAVDGACASSLVAVHLACQSLWAGDSPFALAAGVNAVLEADTTVAFSRSRMLSPGGRCRFGDAAADGFVRSDGVGVVVLERLDDALRLGHRVYALVRETEVSNDARLGKGLFMTPSVEGQEALLHRAWVDNGFDLDRLAFIEAHGTGTKAGDPTECAAVARVLGARRRNPAPLYLGSVKTNIGHAEGAAGVAGLIKAALALHHRTLPASLHFRTPNPDIPWAEGRLAIATESVALPADAPLAGVSSFGLSGTNAHIVLEGVTTPALEARPAPAALLLPVSAHTPEALRERVASLADALEAPDAPHAADLCRTAGARRTHLAWRAAFAASSREELATQLRAFAPPAAAAQPAGAPLAMVFPGQGGQWVGMGRGLLSESAAFRDALAEIDDAVRALGRPSVLADLRGDDDAWARDPARLQPALFAVEVALAAWWRSAGVAPAAVVGHSMGEVAAACVAGALTVSDAARVMVVRSGFLARLRGCGRMAALGLDADAARGLLADFEGRVSIAVNNARATVVVSGEADAVAEVTRRAAARGAFAQLVDVDAASHSALVDPYLAPMREALADVRPRAASVPFFSTVDAAWRDGESLDADYWCANLRRAVRFWESSTALLDAGFRRFVEAGPHPVLVTPLLQTIRERGDVALAVGSTRRNEPEARAALASLGALYAHGADPDWEAVHGHGPAAPMPPFPFQHDTFWFREGADRRAAAATSPAAEARAGAHPLLGEPVLLAGSAIDRVWTVPLSTARFPYLEDHLVRGSAILPGAAYVELALAAAQSTFPDRPFALADTAFREYLAVPSLTTASLQVQLRAVDAATCAVRFYTFDDAPGRPARLHAETTVRLAGDDARRADPFRSPRALFAEALRVEMARAESNPAHRFAVLSAARDGDPAPEAVDAVTRALREIVRREDDVFALAENRWALLLRGLSASVSRAQVAARLRALARERLAHLAPSGEVRLQLVEAGADAHRLADDLTAGRVGGSRPGATSLPPPAASVSLTPDAFYTSMARRGVSYGPTFRPVVAAEQSAGTAVSRLEVPAALREEIARYSLHPAVLDGCFQAAAVPFLAARGEEGGEATFLPVGVGRVVSLRPPSASLTCRAWLRPAEGADDDAFEVDVVITDHEERTVAEIDRLRLRRVTAREVPRLADGRDELFHAWSWVAASDAPAARVDWSVVGDSHLAASLAARLPRAPGSPRGTVVVVDPAADDAPAVGHALAREVARIRPAPGEAHRLVVVTTAGTAHRGEPAGAAHAGAVALCRVAANERPELAVQCVDLPAEPADSDLARLADLLAREPADDELAVRHGEALARQLKPAAPGGEAVAPRSPSPGLVTAVVDAGGAVRFDEVSPAEAPADALDLHVRAAALTAGPSPAAPAAIVGELARDHAPTGLRAGARVVAWVRHHGRADRVIVACRMAVAPDCAAQVPDGVSDLQALTAAALYLEPALAVRRVASVRAGERVLVHEADGARGRAACDVARSAGATVLASAGSFADRDALRASGVAHALHSRSDDLAAAVLDLTGADGVDVILLAGAGASGELVARAGALGARVVRLGGAPGEAATHRNTVAGGVDLDAVARERPAVVRRALADLLAALAGRTLEARASLPPAVALADLPDALADADDPVVVAFEHPRAPVPLPATVRSRLRPDATYLLTGGTGGLGLALADWLVAHGARRLCLVSRSGLASGDAAAKVEALRAAGVEVTCPRAAADDREAMAGVVHEANAPDAPLRGVFHLAGALSDATLEGLTPAHFDAVMRPKLDGARALDALTRGLALDHFVLFGSAAAVLGSPAQGNYAAANAAMEALVSARRAAGLPALSIAWGVWGEVGLAARAANRGARLDARGLGEMPPEEALDALGRLIARGAQGEVGVFAIDWARWVRAFPRAGRGSRFAPFLRRDEAADAPAGTSPATPEAAAERARLLLAEVLRVPPARLAAGQSLAALGLDSLMTVEFRARVLDALKVDLAPARILAAASVDALCRDVAAAFAAPADAPAAPPSTDAVPAADLALDDDIRVTAGGDAPAATDVLLTGATGFVGAHVARALLDDGRATLRCLVRARDAREARGRVESAMRAWGVHRDGDGARITPVLGDLAAPGLGLSADDRAIVARDVDAIVHAAAHVNHMFPYARLREANVRGTAEVLRLATAGRRKAVHHVSSLAVFPLDVMARGVDESSDLADRAEPFFGGYAASKWAAEHLCREARARGLDVRVHRPAQVTGSTAHALSPASDVLWRLVATAVALGAAPDLHGGVNLVPVDFVARAIAAALFDPSLANATLHLMSPRALPVASAVSALRRLGYAIETVPAGAWIPRVERSITPASPLATDAARLREVDLPRLDATTLRCTCEATLARLPAELRPLAHVDEALFARYVRELVARGELPAPPRAARERPSFPPGA